MRTSPATRHLITSLTLTAAALLTALALPVPAQAWEGINISIGWGNRTAGSGNVATITRELPAFTALRVDGPLDVTARPGAAQRVQLSGDDNLLPLIETTVEGSTLVVRPVRGASFRTSHALKVELSFTRLDAAAISGSGDIRVDDLKAAKFEASVAGSGDLRMNRLDVANLSTSVAGSGDVWLNGKADEARHAIAGSGDVHAAELSSRRVNVSISGSGDMRVNASESLDASVAGSGDIVYGGRPANVRKHIAGSGSISAAD